MMLDLDMASYGPFVWGSWALTATGLGVIVVRSVLRSRVWSRREQALHASDSDPS